MEKTKTRRAPERPQATKVAEPVEVQEQVVLKNKKPKIRRNETLSKTKEYIIPKNAGVVFLIPQKGVTVYDEDTGKIREIRYCPNENSIYVDEQGDNARREAVVFRDGRLFVTKNQPNLSNFLDAHPLNIQNGGLVFKQEDKKRDAEIELEKEFHVNEAVSMVREKNIQDLLPVAMYFKVNINAPVSEIRYGLLRVAKSNPQGFIEAFDSPQVKTRSLISQAADYQIIKIKKNGVYWFDSNSLIVSIPVGQEALDVASRFCLTEKGYTVLNDIENRLNKLA